MPKIKFNIKNAKYSLRNTDGTYSQEVKSIGGAHEIVFEPTYSEQHEYADGQRMFTLTSDQGLTGTLTMKYIEDQYEKDMGRLMELEAGLASIEQISSIPHAIYFETEAQDESGRRTTSKTWLLNVTSGKPAERYTQTQDSKTINNYDLSLTINGEYILNSDGETLYIDENGNTRKVWLITCTPDMPGFATFGNSVPIPKKKPQA